MQNISNFIRQEQLHYISWEISKCEENTYIGARDQLKNTTWSLLLSSVSILFFATKHLENMAMAVPPSIISCCNKRQSMLLRQWTICFCFLSSWERQYKPYESGTSFSLRSYWDTNYTKHPKIKLMDKQTNKTTEFQTQELNHQTLSWNCEQTSNTPFTCPAILLLRLT